MSEAQKWLTSISGAIVGQVIVLLFFMLLINRPQATEITDQADNAPQEITIMLSELQTEPELPEPEPEPEPEKQLEREKRFINTDANTAAEEAPKDATFESDRNTIASTRFKPNDSLPQEEGPTTVGRDDAPTFELRDQELQDGEIQHSATPPPIKATIVPQPVQPEPAEEQQKTETTETEQQADKLTETETDNRSDDPTPESSQEELLQIGNNGPKPNEQTNIEEKEVSNRELPKEVAPLASPKEIEKELEAYRRQLTMGAFSSAFQAETRQSNRNGNINNIGEGSVNAESTAVGAYKKAVSSAIAKKWHAYRRTNGIASPGYMRVSFSVNSKGTVYNLLVRTNEADTTLNEFSLKAIRDADIPPMPAQVIKDLGPGGLKMNYDISIY